MEEISCIITICSLHFKPFLASKTNCLPEREGSLQENRRTHKTGILPLGEEKHYKETQEPTPSLKIGHRSSLNYNLRQEHFPMASKPSFTSYIGGGLSASLGVALLKVVADTEVFPQPHQKLFT